MPKPRLQTYKQGSSAGSAAESRARAKVEQFLQTAAQHPELLASNPEFRLLSFCNPEQPDGQAQSKLSITHVDRTLHEYNVDTEVADTRKKALGAIWAACKLDINWMTFYEGQSRARLTDTDLTDQDIQAMHRKASLRLPESALSGDNMSVDGKEMVPVIGALAEHLKIYSALAAKGVKAMQDTVISREGAKGIPQVTRLLLNSLDPDLAPGLTKDDTAAIAEYQGDIWKLQLASDQLRKVSKMSRKLVDSCLGTLARETEELSDVARQSKSRDAKWVGAAARHRALSHLDGQCWDDLQSILESRNSLETLANQLDAWTEVHLEVSEVKERATKLRAATKTTDTQSGKGARQTRKLTKNELKETAHSDVHTKGLFTPSDFEKATSLAQRAKELDEQTQHSIQNSWFKLPFIKDVLTKSDLEEANLQPSLARLTNEVAKSRGVGENWQEMTMEELRKFAETKAREERDRVPFSTSAVTWAQNAGKNLSGSMAAISGSLFNRVSTKGDPDSESDGEQFLPAVSSRGADSDVDQESEASDPAHSDSDDEFADALEHHQRQDGTYHRSVIDAVTPEQGWTKVDRRRAALKAVEKAERHLAWTVDSLLKRGRTRASNGPPRLPSPSPATIRSVQYSTKEVDAPEQASSLSAAAESSRKITTSADPRTRAQNLITRLRGRTSHHAGWTKKERQKAIAEQDQLIDATNSLLSALDELCIRQDDTIWDLEAKWRKDQIDWESSSGWKKRGQSWYFWKPKSGAASRPITLVGTDQGGYPFMTRHDRDMIIKMVSAEIAEEEELEQTKDFGSSASTFEALDLIPQLESNPRGGGREGGSPSLGPSRRRLSLSL